MRRIFFILQLLAGMTSAVLVVWFRLDELMAPQSAELDHLAEAALAAIVLLSVGMIVVWRLAGASHRISIAAGIAILALTVVSGFAPRLLWDQRQAAIEAARVAEDRRRDEAFALELRTWTATIDDSAAAARPLTAEQAWEFVNLVSRAGYYDDGPNPLATQALALLHKALAAKILDVNLMVQGRRPSDNAPRPLFLQFYKEQIEPAGRVKTLPAQNWEIMKSLAANGADLSRHDAAPLVADLAKTEVPGVGRFIGLR
jgi:hypothetical protein